MQPDTNEAAQLASFTAEQIELVAGLLSTIDFQPSQHHPEVMIPWAKAALLASIPDQKIR